jgi:hypothetical protein
MKYQHSAGYRIRAGRPIRFRKEDIFVCCDATRKAKFGRAGMPAVFAADPLSASACSALGPLADAARCNLGLAGSFAAFRSLAFVDIAGEPIDQPKILFVGTLHTREPGSDSRNQRGQQDCRGDHGCTDQDGHRVSDAIRRGPTIPLIFALSFRRLKQGPVASLSLAFYSRAIFIIALLADFLFAHRRCRDGFATGNSAARLPGYASKKLDGDPRHAMVEAVG